MLVLAMDGQNCVEHWPKTIYKQIYSLSVLFCLYVIPLLVIGICYGKTAILLKGATRSMSKFGENTLIVQRRIDEKRTVRIFMAVVAGFAILTLPNAILFLYVDFSPTVDPAPEDVLHAFAVILFLHTFFNPVCYSVLDKRFREDITLLCACFCCGCKENVKRRQQRSGDRRTSATVIRNFGGQTTYGEKTDNQGMRQTSFQDVQL